MQDLAQQPGQQRDKGHADQGNAAARDQLLHALALAAGVILSITLQQVDAAPFNFPGKNNYVEHTCISKPLQVEKMINSNSSELAFPLDKIWKYNSAEGVVSLKRLLNQSNLKSWSSKMIKKSLEAYFFTLKNKIVFCKKQFQNMSVFCFVSTEIV